MPTTHAKRRVLFVEDEAALHRAYERAFHDRFTLAFATTGAEAVQRFAEFHPDVVVIDLQLPDTDGLEVLRQLRDAEPSIPIVITSGYASMAPVVEMLGIVHSGYLVKPFELETLGASIDTAN